jgi:DNA ligase-1
VLRLVLDLPASALILDGEVLTLRPDGRPQPFQVTAGRVGSRGQVDPAGGGRAAVPAFFDLLHADGDDLLAAPGVDAVRMIFTASGGG